MTLTAWARCAPLLSGLLLVQPAFAAEVADQIWWGGPILTIDDQRPRVEAVAVKGGNILAVGTLSEIERYRNELTVMRDLGGRTLLPGFVDAHGHAFMIGLQAISANLLSPPDGEVKDIVGLRNTLATWSKEHASTEKSLGLILGFGYDDGQLAEQRHPTRHDLDAVSKDTPVMIIHQSGHLGVMNSKALEMAGISAETPDPEGGVIRREEGSKTPNGVLEEAAFFGSLAKQFGHITTEQAQALFVAGTNLLASYGYTTGQEGRATSTLIPFMQQATEAGKIAIDVVAYVDVLQDRDFIAKHAAADYTNGFRVGGAKLTIDGSPQGFTAYRDRPYYNPPKNHRADYRGYSAATPEQVFDAIDWAFEKNIQIITHANGEAASDMLLAAVKTAREKHGVEGEDRRAVLIHGQFLRKDQVASLDELDIFPSLFPMHTFYWGDWHRDRTTGPVNAENISPTGWVRERGMKFTTHHDAPVAFPDSMRVLSATVTRRTRSGDILGPHQRVDVMTALKAMTLWSAYQHFEEDRKGSIEPGKQADFVVLSQDPTTVDAEKLDRISVEETVKSGKTIYRREAAGGDAVANSAAMGDVVSRFLNHWQHSDEAIGHGGHSHGPELLMGAIIDGLR